MRRRTTLQDGPVPHDHEVAQLRFDTADLDIHINLLRAKFLLLTTKCKLLATETVSQAVTELDIELEEMGTRSKVFYSEAMALTSNSG